MSVDLRLKDLAAGDLDGRRLAARIFAELGVAPGALVIPHREAELAVALATSFGAQLAIAEICDERFCRVCGCTSNNACHGPDGPCSWVEPDLCSVCAAYPEPAR